VRSARGAAQGTGALGRDLQSVVMSTICASAHSVPPRTGRRFSLSLLIKDVLD